MKFHGIDVEEGSKITNLVVDSGTTFPGSPDIGELFYLTNGSVGLYVYTGSWTFVNNAQDWTWGTGLTATGNAVDLTANLNDLQDVSTSGLATGQLLYKSASDWTNASNLYWDEANDRLGIGTGTPGTRLDVSGTSTLHGNGAVAVAWGDNTDLGFLTFDGSANPVIRSASSLPLVFQTNGANEAMRIDGNGNVGIGTTAVYTGSLLTVNGNIGIENAGMLRSSGNGLLQVSADPTNAYALSNLVFDVDGSEAMRIDSSGRVGIGTNIPLKEFHVVGTGLFENGTQQIQIRPTQIICYNQNLNLTSAPTYDISIQPGTNEKMRITTAGNVGIGETNPLTKLHLGGSSNQSIRVDSTKNPAYYGANTDRAEISVNYDIASGAIPNSDRSTAIVSLNGDAGGSNIKFATANANNVPPIERLRIDSSGNVLIGSTTGNTIQGAGSQFFVSNNGATGATFARFTNNNFSSLVQFVKSRGTSVGTNTIVQDNDTLGQILFGGADGTNYIRAAQILGEVDGTPGLNDMPGRLTFFTTSDGASTATERMRIDSAGNVGIGTNSPFEIIEADGAISSTNSSFSFSSGPARALLDWNVGVSQARVGAIDGTGTANSLGFYIGTVERARFDSSGNLLINGKTTGTSSAGNLHLFNGTAPTGSVTDGVILYSEDVSASAELKVRDEAGNVTTLSPHNFSLIPEGPSEEMAWAYYSEKGGKRINVDMLKLARMVEKLTGEKLVYEDED